MRKKVKNSEYYKKKFIEKSIEKHKNKYIYDKVNYFNSTTKVEIICKKHGSFFVRPDAHIRKVGCPTCNGGIKYDLKEFLEKCNLIHGDLYDYSLVDYKNSKTKVIIICKKHGVFKMFPRNHLQGQGCSSCSDVKRKTTLEFIIQSKLKHFNKYDYSLVKYINNKTKVKIICKEHGEFEQMPKDHLDGHGCFKCSTFSKGEQKIERILSKLKIHFNREFSFDNCLSESGKKLPYDFYLPNLNILIEYDGKQHFEPVEKFGGIDSFNKLAENDDIRNKFCLVNNIDLIRISYKNEENDIQSLLDLINSKLNEDDVIIKIVQRNKPDNIDPEVLKNKYPQGLIKKHNYKDYLKRTIFDIKLFLNIRNEILSYIIDNYDGTIIENKVFEGNIDCDFYLEEKNIAIKIVSLFSDNELNSTKNKQQERSNFDGIKFIQIFEDIWFNKKEIIKSRLNNIIGKTNKIYARNCTVDYITTKESAQFFRKNHLQGTIGASVKIGLRYNGELVSAMTFGKKRKNMGSVSSEGEWELIRFSNKLNHNVIGSASKLFKFFLKNHNPSQVISYADKCWSDENNVYSKLGMKKTNQSNPSYFYIIGNKRKGRFSYRKDQLLLCGYSSDLTERNMCLNNFMFRIYDAGTFKYVWIKT